MADGICMSFPASTPLPECTVYVYPSHWPTGGGERPRGVIVAEQTPRDAKPIESLDHLLVRRMPLVKRALNVAASGLGLLLLSPLMLLVAAAIKWTSPGPVFFRNFGAAGGENPSLWSSSARWSSTPRHASRN